MPRSSVVSPNRNGCALLDTRKTLPGLLQAQKHAVRVGSGLNQRLALWHGILIKENHIAAASGIAMPLHAAQLLKAGVSIQIKVESLDELRQALDAGATSMLIDDFSLEDMRATCVNAGRDDASGLPTGVLITGARMQDHWCLDAAEVVERELALVMPIDPRA